MIKEFHFILDEEHKGKRLDLLLSEMTGVTRSALKSHRQEFLRNGKPGKLSDKGKEGDQVDLILKWEEQKIVPEDLPLTVVYEDENYLVINKKAGMVVHPAKGNDTGTLVNAILAYRKISLTEEEANGGWGSDALRQKIGIVHRLDKDTSGLIIVAKRAESYQYLSSLFRERKVKKIYSAILKGRMFPFQQTVENLIGRHPKWRKKMAVVKGGGKASRSFFRVIRHVGNYSYVKVRIYTGRTHQIRVHASYLGHPVLGDSVYSRREPRFPQIPLCLAATKLAFFDEFTGQMLTFQIKPPAFMRSIQQ